MSNPTFNQNDPRQIFLGFTRSFEPIIGANGYETVTLSGAGIYTLTPPSDAVACSISVEAGVGSIVTDPIIRYKYGNNPAIGSGNPLYDGLYTEIVSVDAMAAINFIRVQSFTHYLWVQYYKAVVTQ